MADCRDKGCTVTLAAILVVMLIIAIAGCGSGSSTTDASAASTGGSPSEFTKPGSQANKYANFGGEGSDQQREAASVVLKTNFEAREKANFKAQCASLSKAAVKHVEEEDLKLGGAKGCVAAVKLAAEPLSASKEARHNTLSGPIAVLRIKGKGAYALFHGNDKKDYAIPMELEGGSWKVGPALVAVEVP